MQELLVNRLFKLAQEKVWLGEDCPAMTIAVDLGHKAAKQTNKLVHIILFSDCDPLHFLAPIFSSP